MKKVLFVINTMGRAGAEKSMIELMKVLDPSQYELHLLSLINRGEMFDEVPSYVKIYNKNQDNRPVHGAYFLLIRTVLGAMIKNLNIFKLLPYITQNYRRQRKSGRIQYDKLCWKLISEGVPRLAEKFDIAIAYLEGGAAYYVADHVNADKKAVFIHTDYSNEGYSPELDQGCYHAMDRIYIVSEEAKKTFLQVYPMHQNKVQLFYNIINSSSIRKLAEEGSGFQDDFTGTRILTVGRLQYPKAYDIVIPVLADLRKEGYNVKWYIIGEGTLRKELERMIKEYQLSDYFILLGARSNPYPYIRQCDFYVQMSRYEGKSIAIEEAQVLGKAIIASDCSGNREQIHHMENGLLVKPERLEIVNGIKMLLEDKGLISKFEQANRKREFSYRNNLELLYRFLEE